MDTKKHESKGKPPEKNYEWAVLNDPLVNAAHHYQVPLKTVVAELVQEKQALLERITNLEQIAPRKLRDASGNIVVWHCLDHLLPDPPLLTTNH